MPGMSNYLQNKLVDHVFRATSFTMPTGLYVGIFTTTPTASGGGTEVAYTGYTRASISPSVSNWYSTNGATSGASSGTTGLTSNVPSLTAFGSGTIVGLASSVQIVGFGIYDASTGGNPLFYGAISPAKTINNGDPVPILQTSGIQITLGN